MDPKYLPEKLITALYDNDLDLIHTLLYGDFDIACVKYTKIENKPIHHAQSIEAIKMLIRLGADPECEDLNGKTPVFYWCMDNNFDLIKYAFEELGIDPNKEDHDEFTCDNYVNTDYPESCEILQFIENMKNVWSGI